MKQFDVYTHFDPRQARERPLLIILQHDRYDSARTLVVAPLTTRLTGTPPLKAHPTIAVLGRSYVLLTLELAGVQRRLIQNPPVDNLEAQRVAIMSALDHVFSAAG